METAVSGPSQLSGFLCSARRIDQPYCPRVAAPGDDHAVARITRICAEHDDARSLRLALIDEIRHIVAFDAYAWLLTDPETEVGCAPIADVPWLAELPRQIRLKYLTSVNRWTHLERPVVALRASTARREDSLVWRDFLAVHGVSDVVSLVFRDRFGCWAFMELWRIESGERFTDAETTRLTRFVEPITAAIRRCQAQVFDVAPADDDRSGAVVLVLSPDLEVRGQTPDTERFLRALVPTDADRPPVPAGAYNVAAQLLAVEAAIDDHPPTARVHLDAGRWLTFRAARIGDAAAPVDQQDIAVTIESTSPTERLALYARACGLSPRESELLEHLATGADTRQVAALMFLSEHTVQDHLKSVFAKAGVRNRRTLLTRAIGR